jgi:plastocyanin
LIARAAAAVLVATGVAAVAAIPATAGKAEPEKRIVKLGDYFMTPEKLTVPKRTQVVWKWPTTAGDSHDVKLTKTRPKGVKRWQSEIAVSDYTYKKRLKVKGKYVVICSLHPNTMRQKIIVR